MEKQIEDYLKVIIKTMAIASAGIVLLLLGLLHISVGIVRHLTTLVGEALAYDIVGIVFLLVGIVLLLVAMLRHQLSST